MITLSFEKYVNRALEHSAEINALSEKLLAVADALKTAKDTLEYQERLAKLEMLTEAVSDSIAAWDYFGGREDEWLAAVRAEIEELCNAVVKT
ncbi:MAG: hypothetical protein LBU70_01755 [Chitinispirillales bacterium]|jgi:hypothetical protein|nr:hypothetical protein [Chitinispirillales bacterium]